MLFFSMGCSEKSTIYNINNSTSSGDTDNDTDSDSSLIGDTGSSTDLNTYNVPGTKNNNVPGT
jgi:hypothetical protein